MKWLIIQSDGEHKGQDGWSPNWFLRECYALRHALMNHGQRADIWGLRHENYHHPVDLDAYDAVLVAENYEFGWLPLAPLLDFRGLKLHWIIDLHCQGPEPYDALTRACHVVLHSTRHLMADYARRHPAQRHLWFPNGVDDRYFDRRRYAPRARRDDLVFIGARASRAGLLERMEAEAGLRHSYGVTGMAYVEALLRTKIQFNAPIAGDVNYRNFETIGLGAALLTRRHPELEALGFRHAENCLLYSSAEEAVALAKDALRSGSWEAIASAGYEFSRSQTYSARVGDLLSGLIAR